MSKEERITELLTWIYDTNEELYGYVVDCLEKNRNGLLPPEEIAEINDILMHKEVELQVSKFVDFKKIEPVEIECDAPKDFIRGGSSDLYMDTWAKRFNPKLDLANKFSVLY